MLTDWIPRESLAALNEGFAVAIMLEANDVDIDKVVDIQRWLTPLSMAERADLVGGAFEVRSQPGAGTTLIARAPALVGSQRPPSYR